VAKNGTTSEPSNFLKKIINLKFQNHRTRRRYLDIFGSGAFTGADIAGGRLAYTVDNGWGSADGGQEDHLDRMLFHVAWKKRPSSSAEREANGGFSGTV
jgi:hypothetical protein